MAPPSVFGPTSPTLSNSAEGPRPISVPATVPQQNGKPETPLLTVDELVRQRAQSHPNHVIVSYPSSGINYVDYTMRQLDVFAFRVAKFYQQRIPCRETSGEKPAVVALLGPSNLDYLITMLALTRLGHTTLFLSTRISQEAVGSLLKTTNTRVLLADRRYLETAQTSLKALEYLEIGEIVSQPSYDFPIEIHADTRIVHGLDASVEAENNVYIIHSSGSTGLPKPIYQSQKSAVANYAMTVDMKAFITLPLYHNHGICNMFRAIYACKPIHLYNADLPLTREHLTGILKNHDFEIFYGVPYALKLLAETDEGMELLQRLKIVMYGGSACPDDLGDNLVANGVNLVGHYGATEVGQLMTSFRPVGDTAWNYVRESSQLSPYLKWIPRGPGLFECCVQAGWPPKVDSNQPDGSYATKDLFEPHPTIPKAWKYIARLDDTIVLVNGEKFNPVHIEGTIRSNTNVTEAVVFGIGRPSLGALVIPSSALADKSEKEILDIIWPVVSDASRSAEAYARISRNMIKLLPHDCAYPRTDKGSIIRQAFYRTFSKEIDETYDNADVSGKDVKKFGLPQLQEFLRQSVLQSLAKEIDFADDTDFFSIGLDSLQAIQIRNEILKTVYVGGQRLGQTVVFDHPSVTKLAAYLRSLAAGEEVDDIPVESEMLELIQKYSTFSKPKAAARTSIAITGATGSLGAHVIAKLAVDPSIRTIYCLVRASSDVDASQRVISSLTQRRLYHSLPLLSRRKLIALASDLSDPRLGLSRDAYFQVKRDLRVAIHCAWSVNFNMRLSSFEKSNIAGVSNLINLCKAAANPDTGAPAAAFNFCSSISTVARSTVLPVPESVPELNWAQEMGYAQSKCVAEHICAHAAEKTGVTARVLRIGQIVGDTQHGIWNASEAVPMMLQTALTVGALPKLKETPSWLPVDTVAQAVIDISLSDTGSTFTNVTNPSVFDWTTDLLPALKTAGLEFDEVEPKEWIRRLRASNPDPQVNPPIKLVDFFGSKYDKDEFTPSKTYMTNEATSLSPALAEAPVLDQQLVNGFVKYFKENAWCPRTKPVTSKMIVVVAGLCGRGKTTLSNSLAVSLKVPLIEGDYMHCKEAVRKMEQGVPLTDDDREQWLDRVAVRSVNTLTQLGYDSVVVSCSAPRRRYRERLRNAVKSGEESIQVLFLDLQCEQKTLEKRVLERQGHYMSAAMVLGQVLVYEEPGSDEMDVFPVDGERPPEVVFADARWLLGHNGIH